MGVKGLIRSVLLFFAAALTIAIEETEFDGRTVCFVATACRSVDTLWHLSEKRTEQLSKD